MIGSWSFTADQRNFKAALGYSGDPTLLRLAIHTLRLVEAPANDAAQNP